MWILMGFFQKRNDAVAPPPTPPHVPRPGRTGDGGRRTADRADGCGSATAAAHHEPQFIADRCARRTTFAAAVTADSHARCSRRTTTTPIAAAVAFGSAKSFCVISAAAPTPHPAPVIHNFIKHETDSPVISRVFTLPSVYVQQRPQPSYR